MSLQKIMIVVWIGFLSLEFFSSIALAQSNPLCSTSPRWNWPTHTYQSLYTPSDFQKKYIAKISWFSDWDATVQGNIAWHNNFDPSCNSTIDSATSDESSRWWSFWSSQWSNITLSPTWASKTSLVSVNNVKILQKYIKDTCWLSLVADGKIGIKTLNAARICKPVSKLPWTTFETTAKAGALFTDSAWKNPVYDATTQQFVNVPSTVYVDLTKTTAVTATNAPTYGLVPVTTTPTEAPVWESWTPAAWGSCFKNPLPDWYKYTNNFTWNGEWQGDGCSCTSGYKKITKQIQTDKGVQDTVSVCEKCDIKKCNCGVKLNTNIPFIGRCIMYGNTNAVGLSWETTTVNSVSAFPILMGAMIRLLMGVILVVCFGTIIVGGFMMTIPWQYDKGKWLVMKVVWTIVALWSLWLILYLINPNFFR